MFDPSLEEALANLYDLTYLANHALGKALARGNLPLSAESLHRRLLDTIGLLQPPAGSPHTSATWRRYRYLELRYLVGQSHKAVATELGLSVRQAHRVRTSAIEAVATLLKEDLPAPLPRPPSSSARENSSPRVTDVRSPLDDELARLRPAAMASLSDLSRELNLAVETISPLAMKRNVDVQLKFPEGNWFVAVDAALLRQAIVLLLTYAMDQQPDGRINVSIEPGSAGIAVTIIYARSDLGANATQSIEDSRLTTSRRLVQAQGGALELIVGEQYAGVHVLLNPGQAATVLTVDDNPELGRLFEHYLRGTRYLVKRAKTGPTALRLAAQGDVDVVTLDVMMPFQDGWEILRQLRDNPTTRDIPVIVCSILPERDLAFAVGATDFLAKPVTRHALITALDRCCPAESGANLAHA